uniref:mannose-6-phosphate isomerase n=1 Tax=Macrostomum lignano TaxID=282301 RepID=A0A1I8G1G8_9PLAT
MQPLKCAYQNYAWGKIGTDSKVFSLLKQSGQYTFQDSDISKPFAELWMGCHPSGPSKLLDRPDTSLQDWLAANPRLAGGSVAAKDGLPFLFKVLAVAKPLSIQAHPDKALAGRLHAQQPDVYKDANHKPEMAIALTPFKALCGFRQASQIAGYCEQLTDQLGPVVGADGLAALRGAVNAFAGSDRAKEAIRLAYSNLMRQPESAVKACLDSLLALDDGQCRLLPLLREIHADFPGDIGCLSVFFMNLIELQPGEAIFLAANLPHAYLSGDCIECMACSDNVVRAGLTPKLKDVDTLLSMLDYEGRSADSCKFESVDLASGVASYAPPVPEFCVVRLCGTGTQGELTPPPLPPASPGILICTAGSGRLCAAMADGGQTAERTVNVGDVLFVPAGCQLRAIESVQLEAYLAYAPGDGC